MRFIKALVLTATLATVSLAQPPQFPVPPQAPPIDVRVSVLEQQMAEVRNVLGLRGGVTTTAATPQGKKLVGVYLPDATGQLRFSHNTYVDVNTPINSNIVPSTTVGGAAHPFSINPVQTGGFMPGTTAPTAGRVNMSYQANWGTGNTRTPVRDVLQHGPIRQGMSNLFFKGG